MIALSAAEALLDFGARIKDRQRADEQLRGAVALHNMLEGHGVAYLADEVGMGKTYVALGALALFRHFDPSFRVLVIAPRANIQSKWMKEMRNFVANNVRFPDLRVRSIDDHPARPLVSCETLMELLRETASNPDRDFFTRLTSFSLPVAGKEAVDPESARKLRDEMRRYLPWVADEAFDLRYKQTFKDNIAKALCCALPVFDLVIVDEGHNLKHGFSDRGAARNRVLALAFGHPSVTVDKRIFPDYGPRAKRVLFLSATPIEETYSHLWNQLHVFGLAGDFDGLNGDDGEAEAKKRLAARFLLRRVTTMKIAEVEYTKNLYRREWRRGGVHKHDNPMRLDDPRQRLVVALVQKKVSELLQAERFNASFQIGMLASFESFLETAKIKRSDEDASNFDDAEQTDDLLEKEGIDVIGVNRLARSYRERFGKEMPHPKMDAIVHALARSWQTGAKTLIFVRRVASVKELKRKLDEAYDDWLIGRLRRELPVSVHAQLEKSIDLYHRERNATPTPAAGDFTQHHDKDKDRGGNDTFFAWFFRGEGPRGVVSGANIQQRFIQRGATYATFFEDNYVADLLGCRPGQVERRLCEILVVSAEELRDQLRPRTRHFLPQAKRLARADRFEAVQASAVQWLAEAPGPYQHNAKDLWRLRFAASKRAVPAHEAPEIGEWLETRTFFTELRQRPDLQARLWTPTTGVPYGAALLEREKRARMLAAAARLGHAFIDLYIMTIQRLGSLDLRTQDAGAGEEDDVESSAINAYLDVLDHQRQTPLAERDWGAFDELSEICHHFDLLMDVNPFSKPDVTLDEMAKEYGRLFREQQPVAGMSGQVNQTVLRQFRMPGYPFVLVTTDLLQEGEDLHTFCSSVHHYGISWTPSAMEQRIGRIDRVRSHTARRLGALSRPPSDDDLLQVYFPHLEDTVEVLQVQRVLDRMNVFLRLMHEGLTTAGQEERTIDTAREFVLGRGPVPQIRDKLRSAFPVQDEQLQGEISALRIAPEKAAAIEFRFISIPTLRLPNVAVTWERDSPRGILLGTAGLGARQQPFTLLLQSLGERPLVRCISPVGRVEPDDNQERLKDLCREARIRLGAILPHEDATYDLTIEEAVLLADDVDHDAARVEWLIKRVTEQADFVEQKLLPGADEPLTGFREDLAKEHDER